MERQPKLIDVAVPDRPRGIVIVLHGGASRQRSMEVSPTQLSVLRMIPIAKRIAREAPGELAVFRLLNRHRGWDTTHTPVHDARWAIAQAIERVGPLPVGLVGHSLGGRAALLTAGDDAVRGAVALAPWVYPDDIAPAISGTPLLIVHGSRDRVASPQRVAALARRLATLTDVRFDVVEGGKHAMLRHHHHFSGPAAEFTAEALLTGGAGAARGPRSPTVFRS